MKRILQADAQSWKQRLNAAIFGVFSRGFLPTQRFSSFNDGPIDGMRYSSFTANGPASDGGRAVSGDGGGHATSRTLERNLRLSHAS